jgi:hypothetical protein
MLKANEIGVERRRAIVAGSSAILLYQIREELPVIWEELIGAESQLSSAMLDLKTEFMSNVLQITLGLWQLKMGMVNSFLRRMVFPIEARDHNKMLVRDLDYSARPFLCEK